MAKRWTGEFSRNTAYLHVSLRQRVIQKLHLDEGAPLTLKYVYNKEEYTLEDRMYMLSFGANPQRMTTTSSSSATASRWMVTSLCRRPSSQLPFNSRSLFRSSRSRRQ